MRIFDGTEYRDATPEEEAEIIAQNDAPHEPIPEERIVALEDELKVVKILLGVE